MKIKSIEPTPNPNSMKLNLDESLPEGIKLNYKKGSLQSCPDYIRRLFDIEGVKGVYQVADFLSLERNPKTDWQSILTQVRTLFESESLNPSEKAQQAAPVTGEYQVLIQMFKGIPMQIKLLSGTEDIRVALPEQFGIAAKEAVAASQNFLKERKWVDQGIRYGEAADIGEEVLQLVIAAYDENRLKQLIERAAKEDLGEAVSAEPLSDDEVNQLLDHPDWQRRYAALDQLNPTQDSIDVVVKAQHDTNSSIRRLAAVYLGA
ncbi:MAG: ypgR, partial [Bacilli bacterium]|nr:ypgR [Bacilli bacterium]